MGKYRITIETRPFGGGSGEAGAVFAERPAYLLDTSGFSMEKNLRRIRAGLPESSRLKQRLKTRHEPAKLTGVEREELALDLAQRVVMDLEGGGQHCFGWKIEMLGEFSEPDPGAEARELCGMRLIRSTAA